MGLIVQDAATFDHLADDFRHLHADVREGLSGLVLVAEDVFVEPFQLVDRLAFYDRGVIDIGKVSGCAAERVEEVDLFVRLEVHGEEAVFAEKGVDFGGTAKRELLPHAFQLVFPLPALLVGCDGAFHFFWNGAAFPALRFP